MTPSPPVPPPPATPGVKFTTIDGGSFTINRYGSTFSGTYSLSHDNGLTWEECNIGQEYPFEDEVLVKGVWNGTKSFDDNAWSFTGDSFQLKGVESIIGDATSLINDGVGGITDLTPYPYAFAFLFAHYDFGWFSEVRDASGLILPSTTLSKYCYCGMFDGTASLEVAPSLPATTLAIGCYQYMFSYSGIASAPDLPAMTITDGAYCSMFGSCPNLVNPPIIAATSISEPSDEFMYGAMEMMFMGCPNLVKSPDLHMTSFPKGALCMFCSTDWDDVSNDSMTMLGSMTITSVGDNAFDKAFKGSAVVDASGIDIPDLTATNGFFEAFKNCENLTIPPHFSGNLVGANSFDSMFQNCTALTICPELPATNDVPEYIDSACAYQFMFDGCTSMTGDPIVNIKTAGPQCYQGTFRGTNITSCKIMSAGVEASGAATLSYMLADCPNIEDIYFYIQSLPMGSEAGFVSGFATNSGSGAKTIHFRGSTPTGTINAVMAQAPGWTYVIDA